MKLLLLIFPIIFQAISHGLNLRGDTLNKIIGKQFEVLMVASWFMVMYLFWPTKVKKVTPFWKLPVIYFLLRLIFFNYIHNISAGLPIFYLGTVSFIDKILAFATMGAGVYYVVCQVVCGYFVYAIIKNKL